MSMPTVSAASKTSQKIWQNFGCFQAVRIIKLVIINLKFSLGLQEARQVIISSKYSIEETVDQQLLAKGPGSHDSRAVSRQSCEFWTELALAACDERLQFASSGPVFLHRIQTQVLFVKREACKFDGKIPTSGHSESCPRDHPALLS